jgi:hypothetical protein
MKVGICSAIVVVLLWYLICLFRDLDPLVRFKEFLAISLSNQNWAYSYLGNKQLVMYSICYYVFPIVVIVSLIFLLTSRNKITKNQLFFLLVIALAYFMNFERGLVRHSVVELGNYKFWTVGLYFSLYASVFLKNKNLFPMLYSFIILFIGLLYNSNVHGKKSVFQNAEVLSLQVTGVWGKKKWKNLVGQEKIVSRVRFADAQKYNLYKKTINTLLKEDESFVDFANASFLYSYLKRFNPVYVMQSPAHISGEFAQEQFVKQLETQKNKLPLLIMPFKKDHLNIVLDEVLNSYRYYKVAEYLYQNYRPFLAVKGLNDVFWCLNEKCDELKEKIVKRKLSLYHFIDYGYDDPSYDPQGLAVYNSELHDYKLGRLPGIWAKYDKASDNQVLLTLEKRKSGFFIWRIKNIDKSKGNYLLLTLNEPLESSDVKLRFGECTNESFLEKALFEINVNKQSEKYLLRISTDYNWYLNKINCLKIDGLDDSLIKSVQILEGD